MQKVVRVGRTKDGDAYAEIKFTDGKLSISGVVGPKSNGDARGSCGQWIMGFSEYDKRGHTTVAEYFREWAPGWDLTRAMRFFDIWDRWHLNHLRAGCEHQRTWDTRKEIELIGWTWTTEFHRMRDKAASGKQSPEEMATWPSIASRVEAVTIKSPRCHCETEETLALERGGWIKRGKSETKPAGWTYPEEHPEGLLTKPCEVCGYKYGTAWKKEDIPAEVIDWLFALPDTDKKPVWI